MPSRIAQGATRGWIIPIGGGEEKENKPQILQRFVDLCGGAEADIVVLPTASRLNDTGARYERIFSGLGAARVTSVDFDSRAQCENPASLARIAEASGVFFTGGNQLSLSTILGGTPVAKLIRTRNAEGVHVAGTSAGASFISEHMIAFGEEGGGGGVEEGFGGVDLVEFTWRFLGDFEVYVFEVELAGVLILAHLLGADADFFAALVGERGAPFLGLHVVAGAHWDRGLIGKRIGEAFPVVGLGDEAEDEGEGDDNEPPEGSHEGLVPGYLVWAFG